MENTESMHPAQGFPSPLDRLRWVATVARDPSLPSAATRVAALIAQFMNSKTGRAFPSQRTLADSLGLGVEAVRRAIVAMVGAGHLIVQPGRGCGHSSTYRIGTKIPSERREVEQEKALDMEAEKPSKTRQKTPLGYAPNKGKEQENKNKGDIYLADASENAISSSNDFLKGQPKSTTTLSGLMNSNDQADCCVGPDSYDEAEAGFDRFWRAFPRREARGAARKAWTTALKRGADPDVIVRAASRYADRRAATEPDPDKRARFTLMPANWLNGERWADEDPPTNGVLLDGLTGAPVVEPARQTAKPAAFDPFEFGARYAATMGG